MKQSHIEHFVSCYLDHNNGLSNGETVEMIREQLNVSVYKEGLAAELTKAFRNPTFSWLSIFTRVWDEPASNELYNEEDAREFAIRYLWAELFADEKPPV